MKKIASFLSWPIVSLQLCPDRGGQYAHVTRPSESNGRKLAFFIQYLDFTLHEPLEGLGVLTASNYCTKMHRNDDFRIK